MGRLTRWAWPPGTPRLPLAIAGHGQIRHSDLKNPERLIVLAGAKPAVWGLLFVLDNRGRRWTLYSPDPEYTAMCAPVAHTVDMTFEVFATKFPGWNRGWQVT